MAYYYSLRYNFRNTKERNIVVDNMIRLKKQIDGEIPEKDLENNLLLATWNIRDFGKSNRRGFGRRTKDSLYYIAEVISAFDLVAVQEVNELGEWEKVMRILGPDWDYIATDVADTRGGGNGERMTFVYDKRKVWFKNIAGEIVLPPNLLISKSTFEVKNKKVIAGKQFRRTPFVVSFQAGWFKFEICTVHIYYGKGKEGLEQRIQEIGTIASYLSKRADKALKKKSKATILLGDFNIISPEHNTMKALEDNGFDVPNEIKSRKTNVIETKHYDQIAFKSDKKIIDYIDTAANNNAKNKNAGVFKFFNSVFRAKDYDFYKADVKKATKAKKMTSEADIKKFYEKEWRTYQMSDHNLMWVRLNVNESVDYLTSLKK